MKNEEAEYLLGMVESVRYDENAFTIWYRDDKVIFGAIMHDNPEAQCFFDMQRFIAQLLTWIGR